MKIEQKLIRVKGCDRDNFDYIDEDLLDLGFKVTQISASTALDYDCCYVLYERVIDDNKTPEKQTKKENIMVKFCNEREKHLEKLFDECSCRLTFRNITFPLNNIIYYIGLNDMKNKQYNIRKKAGANFDEINDPIIASYQSIHELLSGNFLRQELQWQWRNDDGWEDIYWGDNND